MGGSSTELKVLIQIVQDSQNALKNTIDQLQSVYASLQKIDSTKTESVAGGLANIGKKAKESALGVGALDASMGKLMSAVKFLAGGFLALEAVRFFKDVADYAARTQVLGTVLTVVGHNAGYSQEQLDKVDKQIQKLGITAQSSKQSMTQFIQAGLPIDQAPKLARAAQDLAVVAKLNSSETFQRMITAIQRLEVEQLRYMGIIVNRDISEQKYALTLGKTKDALSNKERQMAMLMATTAEAIKLEGTYEAAMGDVGKQLTSLDRFFETLKDTIGGALLPTYLVLVQELTLLLKNLQLIAQEETSNKDAAQAFADQVKKLAESMRHAVEWIAQNYDWIVKLAKVYIEFKVIMLAVNALDWGGKQLIALINNAANAIRFIRGLGAAKVLDTAATVANTAAITTNTVAMVVQTDAIAIMQSAQLGATATTVAATTATVAGTAAAKAFSAASLGWVGIVGVVVYSLTKWIAELTGLDEVVGNLLIKMGLFSGRIEESTAEADISAQKAADAIKKNFSPDKLAMLEKLGIQIQRNGRDWVTWQRDIGRAQAVLGAAIGDDTTGDALSRMQAEFAKLQAMNAQYTNLQDDISAKRKELMKQREKELEAERKLNKAARDMSVPESEILKLDKALNVTKKKTAQVQEEWDNLLANKAKADPSRVAAEKALAAKQKEIQEYQARKDKLDEAEKALFEGKFDFSSGKAQTSAFKKISGAFAVELEAFKNPLDGATVSTEKLTTALEEMGKAAKTPADLKELTAQVNEFKKAAGVKASDIQIANTVLASARIAVRGAELQKRTSIIAEEKETYKAKQQVELDGMKNALDALKLDNAAKETLDRQAHENGIISLEQYYARRLARITEENEKELALAKVQLTQAQQTLDLPKYNRTEQERHASAAAVRTAEARVAQAEAQGKEKAQQIVVQRSSEEKQIKQEIFDLTQQTVAAYRGESQTIESIDEKWRRIEVSLKGVEGAKRAVEDARQLEIYNKELEDANKKLEARIALEQSIANLNASQVGLAAQRGELTSNEAMQANNALIRERISLKQKEIEERRKELENLRMISDADYDRRLAEFNNLEAEIYNLSGQLQSYGQELQRTFTDALTTAITDLTQGAKSGLEILKGFAQSITSQIMGTLARDISEKITRKIVEATKNAKGENIFDKIMGKIGLGSKEEAQPGDEGTPLLDAVRNLPQDIAAALSGEGAFGDNSLFGTISEKFGGKKDKGGVDVDEAMKLPDTSKLDVGIKNFTAKLKSIFGGIKNTVLTVINVVAGFLSMMYGGGGAKTGGGGGGGGVSIAEGGLIKGPGTGKSDDVPAFVSNGEYVMTADKTKKWLPLLEAIRSGKLDKEAMKYAEGGMVASLDSGGSALQSIAIPDIVSSRAAGNVSALPTGGTNVGRDANMTAHLGLDEGLVLKKLEASSNWHRVLVRTMEMHAKKFNTALGRA